MRTIYIVNAFSLSMIESDGALRFERTSARAVAGMIFDAENGVGELGAGTAVVSAIGHADTARLVGGILGVSLAVNRTGIRPDFSHDIVVVAQYDGPRLPEGTTVLPEGAAVSFWLVRKLKAFEGLKAPGRRA